jgi:dipeptidyl-peptidase-4
MLTKKCLLKPLGIVLSLCLVTACSSNESPSDETQSQTTALNGIALTNEALYKDYEYNAKRPGAIRWDTEGGKFTALETAEGYEDAELEKDQYGDDVKIYEEIVQYDPATQARTVLISLEQLTPKGTQNALVVDDYKWSKDKSLLLIYTNAKYVWRDKTRGEYWVLNIKDSNLYKLGKQDHEPSQIMFGKFSPDAQKFAYVYLNNVYVQDIQNKEITALTSDASSTIINGLFDWAYEEEFGIQDGFRWSPDSQRIAYWQFDTSAAQDFFIINNTDSLYPKVTAIPYPKVGEENSAAKIGIVTVADSQTVWIDLPGIAKDMYVPRMNWVKDTNQVFIQQMNRKQDTNTVFYADAITAEIKEIFVEKEDTFIKHLYDPIWFENGEHFLWLSERSGWSHIYKVSRDGQSIENLTPGNFDVTEYVNKDEGSNSLYFIASPDNSSQRYLYRKNLDGSGEMTRVTPSQLSGTNSYNFSADATWAIHTHSSFMQPPVYSLISLPDHKTHQVLEDNKELVGKLNALAKGDYEFYQVNAQDGVVLDGYIMRPANFDSTKQYPIINFVYGDPAAQIVRDSWSTRNLWHLMMNQKGFIVSTIDNRGTPAPKGRDWRRAIYGSVGPLGARDQSDALGAICKRWSYIDCSRVGVWGHSGGGSMTLNLLFRYPQQYHVGVSRAPVPDQRLYDSIYQERYSGLLEEYEANYIEAAPVTHAKNLEGKLLLVHGTGDDNVHYQGTERLVNELIKYNKQFDFMAYPNRRHGIVEGEGTSLHLATMQTNYFIKHLQKQ